MTKDQIGKVPSNTSFQNLTDAVGKYASLDDKSKVKSAKSSPQVRRRDGPFAPPASPSLADLRNGRALAKWDLRLSRYQTGDRHPGLTVPRQVPKNKGRFAWFTKTSNAAMRFFSREGFKSRQSKIASLTAFNKYGHELGSGGSKRAQVRKMNRTMGKLPAAVADNVSDELDAGDFAKAEIGTAYPGKGEKRLPLLSFPKSLGFRSSHFSFFNWKSTRLRAQCRALAASALVDLRADKALEVKEALINIALAKGDRGNRRTLAERNEKILVGASMTHANDKVQEAKAAMTNIAGTDGSLDDIVNGFYADLQSAETPQELEALADKIIDAGKPESSILRS